MKHIITKKLIFIVSTIVVMTSVGVGAAIALPSKPETRTAATAPAKQITKPKEEKKEAATAEQPALAQGENTAQPSQAPAPAPGAAPVQSPSNLPRRPLPTPVPIQPTGGPMQVTSVSVALGTPICHTGFGYSYNVEFNPNHTGGFVAGFWEFQGGSGGSNMTAPYMTLAAGTVRIYDSITDPARAMQSLAGPFKARLHITSPNDIFSNWIDVPSGPSC